ncbi:hypothetical protein GCM10010464_39900 [Pseudonocardia yunnanensis]|uniref:Glycoside hydrolase family 42 N-terminal domain-containing protein n=1 Tax=Pseudonocardia yunnanensis TaxID=58107 RepID=A0ABW4F6A1_9PSEU
MNPTALLLPRRLASALAMVLTVAAAASSLASCRPPDGMRVGVLGSDCAEERVSTLADVGVDLAVVDVRWDRFEPSPGEIDPAYVDSLTGAVERCRNAGVGVVLGLGLQYAPGWVGDLPNGRYRNQYGIEREGSAPNVIFSADVRDAVDSYVEELGAVVPFDDIAAIRVGTGEAGELGFPGRVYGSDSDNAFWAFDDAAQDGSRLADGLEPTPLPGWRPGDRTQDGKDVTSEDVAGWFGWYTGSAAEAIAWQIELLRRHGFDGEIHIPLAGRGVLPADLGEAVAAYLDGTADRDGSLERGLFYPDQLDRLGALAANLGGGAIFADVTGIGDATAVQARTLNPPQDTCRPEDAREDPRHTPGVADWSAFRWTIANARHAGLGVVGENPGSPDAPGTGGDDDSEGLAGQMQHAPRYAAECGLSAFFWAFEDDFFSGPREVDITTYARTMGSYRGGD